VHTNKPCIAQPEAKMVENRIEYIAVSTGVVLTALAALVPLFA